MLTLSEKRKVGRYLREKYTYTDGRSVRFGSDGSVTIVVDEMPNTNDQGRIFVGWDSELLRSSEE